jgi:hypothetical protein
MLVKVGITGITGSGDRDRRREVNAQREAHHRLDLYPVRVRLLFATSSWPATCWAPRSRRHGEGLVTGIQIFGHMAHMALKAPTALRCRWVRCDRCRRSDDADAPLSTRTARLDELSADA